jgi:hypothetical protein
MPRPVVARNYPVSRRAMPDPGVGCPRLTAPYAGSPHCWGFPRLACLIHAANVRSEPGSNPSRVCHRPLAGAYSIRLEAAVVRCRSKNLVRTPRKTGPPGARAERRRPTAAPRPCRLLPSNHLSKSIVMSPVRDDIHISTVELRPSIYVSISAGGDLLSRLWRYHRPRVLIGRVRDGNGSLHPGLATGRSLPPCGGVSSNGVGGKSRSGPFGTALVAPLGSGGGGGVAKRSAVSTGRLSVSPRVHRRPIDPVVSREPSFREA